MKAFHFRLQTKLDITVRQEDIARENLQANVNIRNEIEGELNRIADRVQEMEETIRQLNDSPGDFQELVTRRQYLPVLNLRKQVVTVHLEKAEEKVETAREALHVKARETSTLERLREKQMLVYQKELLSEEQKIIDELAITTHFRKNGTKV